ncbi:hypothetical protein [Kitasatospora purpeofusca]|uniref:hypothetical protein n=1 Tax=Kitasatospora purpeofusca TaxID=67352 RepID=UPI000ADBD89C|nr:hypothetical protein OG715_03440 [Kitasatospora purpeofusca]WSR38318.1 hypothetical protein OG196_04040 [Kitasatospora purpeofusca]
MNSWIDLDALWKILVVGLLTGAGLPALFALALRLLNPPLPTGVPTGEPATEPATDRPTAGPAGYALAGLLLAVVLASIGWGISVIVNHR